MLFHSIPPENPKDRVLELKNHSLIYQVSQDLSWWIFVLLKHFIYSNLAPHYKGIWYSVAAKLHDGCQCCHSLGKMAWWSLFWGPSLAGWASAARPALMEGGGELWALQRSLLLSNRPSLLGNRLGERKRDEGWLNVCLPSLIKQNSSEKKAFWVDISNPQGKELISLGKGLISVTQRHCFLSHLGESFSGLNSNKGH